MHLKRNYVRHINCFIAQFQVTLAGEVDPELLWYGESDEINTNHLSLSYDLTNSDFCGPCFGIYFLSDTFGGENCYRRLWNPALHEMKNLPPMITKPNISSNMKHYHKKSYGFGFDPVTEDYKVVAIMGYTNTYEYSLMDYPLSIMIYSLRADSWKYSGDISKPYYIPRVNSCHAFVNRNFYWLGSYEKRADKHDVVIAIDLATEECQEIGLPDICIKGEISYKTYSECLMVYNGSIALVSLYKEECEFDIWTLKGTTWSKELTVELECWVSKPLGHVDNNFVLFDGSRCLILYDPNTEETWELEGVYNDGSCNIVSAYMESLVPLNDRDFWISQGDKRPLLMQ
ncbi:F-box/kelch-repeat protein At3g06240-like [Silene latifolia]|uniref:F-box/kelch-repeat protein At3g06240-like n=1 Tax=Silene latifolia TaxID=37657 RepID=UPI003D775E53